MCVDFDGTIVEHAYPAVGPPVPGAIATMKALQRAGIKLILWTMRDGKELNDAVEYLQQAGIELWAVNRNPAQDSWTTSPKAHGHLYIDDCAFGCPLLPHGVVSDRPMVDWETIVDTLVKAGVIWRE